MGYHYNCSDPNGFECGCQHHVSIRIPTAIGTLLHWGETAEDAYVACRYSDGWFSYSSKEIIDDKDMQGDFFNAKYHAVLSPTVLN